MKQIIDYTLSEYEIERLSDHELAQLLMYSDRDRKELPVANDIYWKCIRAIYKRIEDQNNITH